MTTTVIGLTRDDVHALRTAGSVSFHLHDGHAYIRAYMSLPADEHGVLTGREQRVFDRTDFSKSERGREIECAGTAYSYTGNATGLNPACFHLIYPDPGWSTVATLLKAGDIVTLCWRASNNNQYVNDARLHVDELRLVVNRQDKPPLTFTIGHSVCADNTARMVRFI